MFEKFLRDNVESFAQRYSGTFGFFRDEHRNRLLVKLTEVRPERCDFVDGNGISFSVNPDAADDVGFEFLPPKSAWHNTQQGAMYTERVAQRQFQRGITTKNTSMYLLQDGIPVPVKVDFKNLGAVFDSVNAPKDFLTNLDKGVSFALSQNFALDPRGSVWLYRETIGRFSKKDKHFTFKLIEPQLWKTELIDALTEIGCTSEIN